VRCPWLAIDLDPIALLHDRWSIDELFARAGNAVAHVLARDGIRGDGGRVKSMPVGSGNVNWDELLVALDAAGYHGWITFDPVDLADRAGALRSGLTRLSASPRS